MTADLRQDIAGDWPEAIYLSQLLVNRSPALMAYWDREQRCRFVNKAYERWLDRTREQVLGRSMRELHGDEFHSLAEPHLRAALDGKPQVFEQKLAGRDGGVRNFLIHLVPDVGGAGVAGFTAQFTDVSTLRRGEVALQRVIAALEGEVRERRAAQEQVADLQQSLALALASIGAGYIATNRRGCVTRMNAVAEQVTGWSQADAEGRALRDVLVREDRAVDEAAGNPVDEMIDEGGTIDLLHHMAVVSRDGRRATIEVTSDLIRGDDGEVRGLTAVFRDTTRLVRAEIESNRLAAIVESSFDAIISKTLDGRITSWNGASQAMFGYTPQEAIGQSVQMLVPPEREFEEMRILAELSRGARVPPFDTVRLAKGGERLHLSVTISPIRDATGRIVGASKIARDVSRQRRAEEALRESEARLRFTMESAQIGAWDLDLATGSVHRSLQHDRCFGYDAIRPEWSFDIFLRHVHTDDRAEVARSFRSAVAAGSDWRLECRVTWSDSSVHWIRMHGSLTAQGVGRRRMLGIVMDLTGVKEAEATRVRTQALEIEKRQVIEATRMKSLFLANMSHELRTPLNAIIGFADLLHGGTVAPSSPKHQEFLGHIGASGRHLLQLINDLLDLSKIESGKFGFYPEAVDLPAVVAEVTGVLQATLQKKTIGLSVEVDPSLAGLFLDPHRLKQLLYNYLSNAIKFTPDAGRVTLRATPEGDARFRIEVEDSGIGIAESDLSRLFVEFQQLESDYARRYPGTGLGLALTRRLVQAQGGSVGVRSVVGVGSVFHAVLPRIYEAGTRPDEPAPSSGRRMLVIEGEGGLQSKIVRAVAEAGLQADSASTGQQALVSAQASQYHGMTLDLRLPDQSGLEVLAAIRRGGPNRSTPVLGLAMRGAGGSGVAFAVADILSKPIRNSQIAEAMARFGRHDATRALVLVIDDDPVALDLMSASLTTVGIGSVCLADGREALRQIGDIRPDAIILDLMMPEFDGFEVLAALGALPAWKDTPVFVWTSMMLESDDYERLARSAMAIVTKGGGDVSVLLDRLRRWCLQSQPMQAGLIG